MNLQDLGKSSNAFTDETANNNNVMQFANQAIAKINSEFKSKLPFFLDNSTKYTALDTNWLLLLVGNYISYGIRLSDDNIEGAREFKNLFDDAMISASENIDDVIPEDYRKDTYSGGVYDMDTSNAINVGWFGNRGA